MSGIAGVFHRDGREAERDMIGKMVETLRHRGPDGIQVWNSGPLALGQCLLNPGRAKESDFKFVPDPAKRLAVVGDARIDNLEDLIGNGGEGRMHEGHGELQVIARQFEKRGVDLAAKLDGDFALAICDLDENRVVCMRDHFGVRPLYYAITDDVFIFASEIKAILKTGLVISDLDIEKLEDFLAGNLHNQSSTFYRSIRRLPPGELLIVDRNSVRRRAYWHLDAANHEDGNEKALIEEFKERFLAAVSVRTESVDRVACMLSGGLDSSSVAASAACLGEDPSRITAYSVSFPYLPDKARLRTDESKYTDAVVNHTGIGIRRLSGDSRTPLDSLSAMLQIHDQPFEVPNAYLDAIALSAVREDGLKVLLTGLEGDLTVSHGDTYLTELAYAGRWKEFVKESEALARTSNTQPSLFFERYGLDALEKLGRRGKFRRLTSGARHLGKHFGASAANIWWSAALKPGLQEIYYRMSQKETLESQSALRFINDDYPRRAALIERLQADSRELDAAITQQEHHAAQMKSGYSASLLEFAEKNAAAYGIEVRHPFFDRRLVEHSLALPGSTKLKNGYPRYILRMAMERILPEYVQWRVQKAALGPNFKYLMKREPDDHLRDLVSTACEAFPEVLNKSNVNSLLDRKKYATLWKVIVLGAWILHKPS